MITLKYDILIQASAQKVWNILWDTHTYSQWTQAFSPTSRMQSDWKVGGETLFQDASGNGMVATIVELEQFKHVVFKHLGELKHGVPEKQIDNVQAWNGTLEKYILTEQNGQTLLTAEIEMDEQYQEFMDRAFQQGFAVVKALAEN